jgi:hypothetical protein
VTIDITARIRPKAATAAEWDAADPVLAVNELAIESDTLRIKVGDGETLWTELPYATDAAGGSGPFPDYSEPVQGVDAGIDALYFVSHRGWIHCQGVITAETGTGGSSQFANLPALTVPADYRPLGAVLAQTQAVCLWTATIATVASEGLALFTIGSDGAISGSRMTGTEWTDEIEVRFFPDHTYPDTTTYEEGS